MRLVESRLPRFDGGGFDHTGGVFTLAYDKVRELRLRHTQWIGPVLRQPVARPEPGSNGSLGTTCRMIDQKSP
jgi:hypothetical protein